MPKQTAIEWFYNEIKSHFEHDASLLEKLTSTLKTAKQKERDQHGNTWDNAIKTHEERGHVLDRSMCDFDDYEIN